LPKRDYLTFHAGNSLHQGFVGEKARLKAEAARRGVKLSTLLKMGLEAVTTNVSPADRPSCYDLAVRFFEEPGHIDSSGLSDLSTNKEYLNDFGAKS
jgi:hypothetical protein